MGRRYVDGAIRSYRHPPQKAQDGPQKKDKENASSPAKRLHAFQGPSPLLHGRPIPIVRDSRNGPTALFHRSPRVEYGVPLAPGNKPSALPPLGGPSKSADYFFLAAFFFGAAFFAAFFGAAFFLAAAFFFGAAFFFAAGMLTLLLLLDPIDQRIRRRCITTTGRVPPKRFPPVGSRFHGRVPVSARCRHGVRPCATSTTRCAAAVTRDVRCAEARPRSPRRMRARALRAFLFFAPLRPRHSPRCAIADQPAFTRRSCNRSISIPARFNFSMVSL